MGIGCSEINLLTGAGFTCNWGGWLAKELEGDLLARLANDRELRKLVQESANYEEALEIARSPGFSGRGFAPHLRSERSPRRSDSCRLIQCTASHPCRGGTNSSRCERSANQSRYATPSRRQCLEAHTGSTRESDPA
jgi:hypothetical protein